MGTLFWDVDTQVDFFDKGKLAVPGAEAIRGNLKLLTLKGWEASVTMAGSADAHTPEDREFQVWGEHCVYGTPGQRKIPETRLDDILLIPSRKLTSSQLSEATQFRGQVIFEKQVNDVKSNRNVMRYLEAVRPDGIVLYGVVTEICVDLTVQFLVGELGYSVTVVDDAIREIDPTQAMKARSNWRNQGVKIASTKDVLYGLKRV